MDAARCSFLVWVQLVLVWRVLGSVVGVEQVCVLDVLQLELDGLRGPPFGLLGFRVGVGCRVDFFPTFLLSDLSIESLQLL